jgi:hypothetical protein
MEEGYSFEILENLYRIIGSHIQRNRFLINCYPEDGGRKFLRITGDSVLNYRASHPRKYFF